MTGQQQAPPLRVWAYTALLLLALLLVLANEDRFPGLHRRPVSLATRNMNLARLEPPPLAAVEVVALGSSRTLYALDYDDAFERRLDLKATRVRFHRVTWLGADVSDMEPVLQWLTNHPPQVLILEADLLFFDHASRFPIRDHLRPVEAQLNSLLNSGDSDSEVALNVDENFGRDTFASAAECATRQTSDMRLVYASHVITWKPSSGLRERYLTWLRPLRERGTKIVLVSLPRAPWAAAVFPARLNQETDTLLQRLGHEEGFAIWKSPTLDGADFCDQAHMNPRGRAQFSAWLAQRLSNMLEPHDQ